MARSVHGLTVGQSYNQVGYHTDGSYYGFCEAVRRVIASSPATVGASLGISVAAGDFLQFRNVSVGGSAIVQANGASYWVQNDLASAGPLLTTALASIAAYPTKPQIIHYSHGEQEATALVSEAASFDAKTAILNVLFPQIRSALNPGSPNNVPIFVDLLGPRFTGHELREFWMRDRLLEIIDGPTARVYRGAEKYAVQLGPTVHPTTAGYRQLGAHAGRKAAAWLLDTNAELRGPSITSPSRTGNAVTVTISVPVGQTLIKPEEPDFFGLYDNSDVPIAITGYSWSGNDLTITGASQPAKLRYPAPTGKAVVDISKIIRLADPIDPIYTGEPGLVLESMITAAV